VTRLLAILLVTILSVSMSSVVTAQVRDGDPGGRRMQGGGVNSAPAPGVFTVVSVDSYGRLVRLRGQDGASSDVFVGEDIFDLSKLKAGDKIQVNFIIPDAMNPKLAAASIWPVP
jgi:hypothetical protein